MELALIENLQRQDLNPGRGPGVSESSLRLRPDPGGGSPAGGKSRPAVANALRLLNLDEDLLALVRSGKLSPGHARAV